VLVLVGLSGLPLAHAACSSFDETTNDTPDGSLVPDTSTTPDGGSEAAPLVDSGLRPGLSDCGAATPVDLQNDPVNCKTCGEKCASGTTCVRGECTPMNGLVACSFDAGGQGACEPNDPRQCAGTICGTNQTCSTGVCGLDASACAPPLVRCAAGTSDQAIFGCYTGKTSLNCGMCGNPCPTGTECVGASCVPIFPSLIATNVCVAGCCPDGTVCCNNPSTTSTQVFCVGGGKCP
jgi:hypothetical protein